MSVLLMHPTTYEYVKSQVILGKKLKDEAGLIFAFISQYSVSFAGYDIKMSYGLRPTIMESDWVFPQERFVTYDKNDLEWAKFFGIGRPGIKQVGEIIAYYDTPYGRRYIQVGF